MKVDITESARIGLLLLLFMSFCPNFEFNKAVANFSYGVKSLPCNQSCIEIYFGVTKGYGFKFRSISTNVFESLKLYVSNRRTRLLHKLPCLCRHKFKIGMRNGFSIHQRIFNCK